MFCSFPRAIANSRRFDPENTAGPNTTPTPHRPSPSLASRHRDGAQPSSRVEGVKRRNFDLLAGCCCFCTMWSGPDDDSASGAAGVRTRTSMRTRISQARWFSAIRSPISMFYVFWCTGIGNIGMMVSDEIEPWLSQSCPHCVVCETGQSGKVL